MEETDPGGMKMKSQSTPEVDQLVAAHSDGLKPPPSNAKAHDDNESYEESDYLSAGGSSMNGLSTPSTPGTGLSRTASQSELDAFGESALPPMDRLSMFDLLENFALPQRLESIQTAIQENAERLRRQRANLASRAAKQKNNLVGEWRKRLPPVKPEEQLDKYRKRMRDSVDRVNKRWNDSKTVTLKEKISFVTACLNIFISGYLIGGWPEYFHLWYTAQLAYFMPVRWYTYHKIGFHYFLADLCYFVNLLLTLSIWFFPQSKRLFISTFCLCFGNNAVAIAMWRNSLVFHSLDKVTSLFIHIMPCATLHVMVHLLSPELLLEKFPAIHTIKYSPPDAPEHYSLPDMIIWATLPYAVWQLSYHFLITVRKRSKIAAGRPTSFTWLRRSYRNNILGKFVLSFPESLQESVFMAIQYSYALLTMLPCPIWFWYRWASASFLMAVFAWACWNGATYYIDVFGRRMEKELEQLKKDVAKMSQSPGMGGDTPVGSPETLQGMDGSKDGKTSALDLGPAAQSSGRSQSDPGADAKEAEKTAQANGTVENGAAEKKNE